jgi:hypothetical protein
MRRNSSSNSTDDGVDSSAGEALRSRLSSLSAWTQDPDHPLLDLGTLRFTVANDMASLRDALNDTSVNIICGDVILLDDVSGVVIMKSNAQAVTAAVTPQLHNFSFDFFRGGTHTSSTPGPVTLTLDAWAHAVAGAGRGVRVSICEWRALAPTLAILKTIPGAGWLTPEEDGWEAVIAAEQAADLAMQEAGTSGEVPVLKPGAGMLPLLRVPQRGALCGVPALIIAAEPLSGPHGMHAGEAAPASTFNPAGAQVSPAAEVAAARTFLRHVGETLPLAIVAMGWTTAAKAEGGGAAGGSRGLFYDESSVDLMEAACRDAAIEGTRISLPLRASYVRETLKSGLLSRLLSGVPGASLLVWSPVPLSVDENAWLKKALPKEITAWALQERPDVCGTIKEVVEATDEDDGERSVSMSRLGPAAAAAQEMMIRRPSVMTIALVATVSGLVTTAAVLSLMRMKRR